EVGEEARVEEVDLGLEGRLEAVLPPAERRQDREVLRLQLVAARAEEIGGLSLVDEERGLVLANRELRAHLDLLVVDRKLVDERIVRVIEPLDDLDELRAHLVAELGLDVVEQAHEEPPSTVAAGSGSRILQPSKYTNGEPRGFAARNQRLSRPPRKRA